MYGAPLSSSAYIYASPVPAQPTVYVQQSYQPAVIVQQQPAPVVYQHQQPAIIVHEQHQQKGMSDEETVVCASYKQLSKSSVLIAVCRFFGMLGAMLCIAASAESSRR
jgi:hypothetical protein